MSSMTAVATATAPKPTFLGVPFEIRRHIYEILLSGTFVSYVDSDYESNGRGDKEISRQYLNFQVVLFRVNKQISSESFEYFRTMNPFILIESDQWWTYRNSMEEAGYAIPMIRLKKDEQLKKNEWALTIRITRPNRTNSFGRKVESPAVPFAITTARHLPTLVRLINALHGTKYSMRQDTFNIRLVFRSGRKKNPAIFNLLDSVAKFRGFNRLDWDNHSMTQSILDSDLDSELEQQILSTTSLPYVNLNEIPRETRKTKERGDQLAGAGRYGEARSEYAIAAVMMGIDFWAGGSKDGNEVDLRGRKVITDGMKTLKLQLYIAAAIVESKIGCYNYALTLALRAYSGTSWESNNSLLTPTEEVELLVLTGSLQTRFNHISQALPKLEKALVMSPSDDIREKIKTAKMIRLKKYYAERDELLARWAAEKEQSKNETDTEIPEPAGGKRRLDQIS